MKAKPKIALTMGDPAGIGPEIVVRAACNLDIKNSAEIIVYGCPNIIEVAANRFSNGKIPRICPVGDLCFENLTIGENSVSAGLAARDAVIEATNDALSGKVDAIVTAPMSKAAVNLAGIPFTGHTELIAELCETANFAMMQSAGELRVAFVTTHIALREVAKSINSDRIVDVGKLLYDAILSEGVAKPKLAVAGLNPHAGEDGHMGDEDNQSVKPAIKRLRSLGIEVEGPFPSDTLFIEKVRTRFDGILAMYHDQGHIPFKMLAFESGVNSTLGLPIIRTSVDHGTAFNISWSGKADLGSLEAALRLAISRANYNSFRSQLDIRS